MLGVLLQLRGGFAAIPGTAQSPLAALLQPGTGALLSPVLHPVLTLSLAVVLCLVLCPSPATSTVCAGLSALGTLSPGSTQGLELAGVFTCSWCAAGICPLCGHWEPLGSSMLGASSLPWLLRQCWSPIHAGCVGLQGEPQAQAPLQSDSAFEPRRDGECRCPILPDGHLPANKIPLSADL